VIPPPQPPAELVDRHITSRALGKSEEGDRVLFLERADYVSPDYAHRLLVEFDWHRAAAAHDPWRVRLYVRKDHATSPNGVAWRLAQRATWSPSLRAACDTSREWMMRERDGPPAPRRPHRRLRPARRATA